MYKTVREEIDARLAAIKPEQLVAPPNAISRGEQVIGDATEEMKRLFTLLFFLQSEVCEDAEAYNNALSIATGEDRIVGYISLETVSKLDSLRKKHSNTAMLAQCIKEMLYLEVGRQPWIMSRHNVGIREGWKLCHIEPQLPEVADQDTFSVPEPEGDAKPRFLN